MTLGVVLALAVGTYAIRLAGPLLRDRISLSPKYEQLMSVAAITVLAAFIATTAVFESTEFAGWARVVGVTVGGVLAWRKASFLVVVLVAAATTAGLRLLGWS